MIVKSEWYDGRFVTLLLWFHYFVLFSYGLAQPIPVFSAYVNDIYSFVFTTKTNNRLIIGIG